MTIKARQIIYSSSLAVLLLFISGTVLAQDPPSACVQQGAMAWDNWTKTDSGGDGTLPAGETNGDYIRCKACHGWDVQGTEGGYIRRSRKDSRPNAGAGDGDSTPRAITRGSVTTAMIAHDGSGRTFAEGSGSWVALNDMGMHNSGNTTDHASGYTLGNQHPDFSGGELTAEQITCLTEFLNYTDADQSTYFANIDPGQNPVLYSIVGTADAVAGESFYNANCMGCHGDPATDHNGANGGAPDGGILAYLAKDGKFSEFSHKARWGIPGSSMTYAGIGAPTSANIADMMLYLQELGGTGFAINTGLSGDWFNQATRDGEGFLIDVGTNLAGDRVVIIAFYTYDSMGNQAWILGAGTATGNTVVAELFLGEDNFWGDDLVSGGTTNTPWGTITFKFSSCTVGHVALLPNMAMEGRGFTALEYDVTRDLLLHKACPIAD
jgi:hypothetical protein